MRYSQTPTQQPCIYHPHIAHAKTLEQEFPTKFQWESVGKMPPLLATNCGNSNVLLSITMKHSTEPGHKNNSVEYLDVKILYTNSFALTNKTCSGKIPPIATK
jgi:hypothetical protein